jgi:DNA-directed RNA polymerase specialized sigma24 family protein
MSDPASDAALAQALVDNESPQLAVFVERFKARLQTAYEGMSNELKTRRPPGCREPFGNLTPHVGNRSGAGFVHRPSKLALAEYVARLELQDLFLVAAGLRPQPDRAASEHIFALSESIARCAAARFRSPCREKVIEDGPGHLWESTAGCTGNEPAAVPPGPCQRHETSGRPRLAGYLGTSKVTSWMLTCMVHLGLDCARKQVRDAIVPIGPDVDDDRGTGPEPVAPPAPGDWHIAELLLEELTLTLHQAVEDLKQKSPRRYQVAYLWLHCRFRKSEIAEIEGITRPAVAQHVPAILQHLVDAAEPVGEDLARRTNKAKEWINGMLARTLDEDPGRFFEPILFNLVLDAYRALRDERPDLLHLAMLHWKENVPVAKLAGRMAESPWRVDKLLAELADWQQTVAQTTAAKLEADCGVAAETLFRWIYPLVRKWLSDVADGGSDDSTE